ncbi:ABC transporter substrate-binding protein [Rhizobium sp. AC44/96]|uniref:extracellular solute-binding protein n=1 Tax=Rhizobium sp. AC44/96 TaxID=1841654 RepID=UPI00080FAD83|nr:extracellular solute-binding protein [Rhizobium sp. AC44/96]OCJ08077.1 ABC transporter substrate-binding protein [Rhizobium sp. AC44/96]
MDEFKIASALPVSRRAVLGAGLFGAAMLASPFVRRAAAAEDNVLYVNTWGGDWEAAVKKFLFDPFTKDTGIEIRTVSPISFAKLSAQKTTGVYEFDVTTLGVADVARANAAGLLESFEGRVDPAKLWKGAVYENGLATHGFATQLAYNASKFSSGGPKNWADFFDTTKFPGNRSLQRHAARVLAIALLADGVPADKLFPYDLDRAFASLDKIKPDVRVWWTAGPQARQILADGEVDLAALWDSDALGAKKASKDPIEVVWDQAVIDQGCWIVAKDSPHAENGFKLINHIGENAEGLAQFCIADSNGPMNPKSFDFIPAGIAKTMPTYPEHLARAVMLDGAKLLPQLDDLTTRFESWVGI